MIQVFDKLEVCVVVVVAIVLHISITFPRESFFVGCWIPFIIVQTVGLSEEVGGSEQEANNGHGQPRGAHMS